MYFTVKKSVRDLLLYLNLSEIQPETPCPSMVQIVQSRPAAKVLSDVLGGHTDRHTNTRCTPRMYCCLVRPISFCRLGWFDYRSAILVPELLPFPCCSLSAVVRGASTMWSQTFTSKYKQGTLDAAFVPDNPSQPVRKKKSFSEIFLRLNVRNGLYYSYVFSKVHTSKTCFP